MGTDFTAQELSGLSENQADFIFRLFSRCGVENQPPYPIPVFDFQTISAQPLPSWNFGELWARSSYLQFVYPGKPANEKNIKTAIIMQSGFNCIHRCNNSGMHLKRKTGHGRTGRLMGLRPLKSVMKILTCVVDIPDSTKIRTVFRRSCKGIYEGRQHERQ